MNSNIMDLYGFEPYLQFYPSPESPFCYSTISDQQVYDLPLEEYEYPINNNNNDDYAMLSFLDNTTPPMLDAYTTFIPNYIPDHMMLLQKSYSEPSRELVQQLEIHSCLWVNCHKKAPTLERLMQHICEQHIGSGKAIYFCEWKDCPRNKKPFMKRHKMHNHMRTHTGERPFVCTVQGCNKTFSRPDSLSTHIKTHSDIRPYLCSVPGCEKAYFHSRSLRKHVKSCHLNTTTTTTSARRNTPSSTTTSHHPY